MVFPRVNNLPRHPSHAVPAGLEGLLLLALLWIYSGKTRPRGAVFPALFFIGYAGLRFLASTWRARMEERRSLPR